MSKGKFIYLLCLFIILALLWDNIVCAAITDLKCFFVDNSPGIINNVVVENNYKTDRWLNFYLYKKHKSYYFEKNRTVILSVDKLKADFNVEKNHKFIKICIDSNIYFDVGAFGISEKVRISYCLFDSNRIYDFEEISAFVQTDEHYSEETENNSDFDEEIDEEIDEDFNDDLDNEPQSAIIPAVYYLLLSDKGINEKMIRFGDKVNQK